MSLSRELCWSSVDAIVTRLGLSESAGPEALAPESAFAAGDTAPYMVLVSPMSPEPVGVVRVFSKPSVCTVVYIAMTVPMIGLDSHMMFAFTPADSAVPHFTVDSVRNADDFAFHLDLIPRLDLGAHLGYMDHVFAPLTEARAACLAIPGLTPAHLEPRQWALMSEWMLANRADESAFRAIGDTVGTYRDHWFGLVDSGVPVELLDGVDEAALIARDEANRSHIFNPDVDRVWANVARLLGEERSEEMRQLLASAGAEAVLA
jgi:hypothetical protein